MSIGRYTKTGFQMMRDENGKFVKHADYAVKISKIYRTFDKERTAMMQEIDDLREQLWKPPCGNQMLNQFNLLNKEEEMTVVLPKFKKGQTVTIKYE